MYSSSEYSACVPGRNLPKFIYILIAYLGNIWKNVGLLEICEQLKPSSYGAKNWALWKIDQK